MRLPSPQLSPATYLIFVIFLIACQGQQCKPDSHALQLERLLPELESLGYSVHTVCAFPTLHHMLMITARDG